ncbi:cation:dicarboxylate symporter family transporter [Fictibacillus sp. FJAT-27399]|uniref:cation:dicarboxylate symporter family transporter n=1 Tax=Fictibacillus sp. FJAT-27399 TaxID=1729689 RepID=UPI0007811F35|nr:cation:dicarboxylase symporter family transporter [Fictibacillus sp. FJAT-27399]
MKTVTKNDELLPIRQWKNLEKPGADVDIHSGGKVDVSSFTKEAKESEHGFIDFIVGLIPDNLIGAFASGEMLPVLFISVLFGLALAPKKDTAKPVITLFDKLMHVFFKVVHIIMKFSPFAAFGPMANTIGEFCTGTLFAMGKLIVSVYACMFLFIIGVLGLILKLYGVNIFKFLAYIKEEIFLTFSTCSSEPVLPDLMKKLEKYGCSKSVVGFVTPTGYAFNLDGTAIYLTLAALFIGQAYGIDLSLWQQLTLLGVMMLTSKGAAAVTGGGFITLGATLTAFPMVPIEGLAILLGVDRFLAEARGVTNLIGNGVASLVISKSENEFNPAMETEDNQPDEVDGDHQLMKKTNSL